MVTKLAIGAPIDVPDPPIGSDKAPQFGSGGTEVYVRVFRPEGDIAALDVRSCRLVAAADDRGTDLLKKTIPGFNKAWPSQEGAWAWENDRHGIDIHFWFADVPADEATKITLKGELVLECGKEPKTEVLPEQLGEHVFKHIHLGSAEFSLHNHQSDNQKLDIWLGSPPAGKVGEISRVERVIFLDGAGSPVPSELAGGSSRIEDGCSIEDSRVWEIEKPPSVVRMQITYFQKLQSVRVPFQLEIARPKVPPGPYETSVPMGIAGCALELSYDKYALTEFGISPKQVDEQIKAWFDTHAGFSMSELH